MVKEKSLKEENVCYLQGRGGDAEKEQEPNTGLPVVTGEQIFKSFHRLAFEGKENKYGNMGIH